MNICLLINFFFFFPFFFSLIIDYLVGEDISNYPLVLLINRLSIVVLVLDPFFFYFPKHSSLSTLGVVFVCLFQPWIMLMPQSDALSSRTWSTIINHMIPYFVWLLLVIPLLARPVWCKSLHQMYPPMTNITMSQQLESISTPVLFRSMNEFAPSYRCGTPPDRKSSGNCFIMDLLIIDMGRVLYCLFRNVHY